VLATAGLVLLAGTGAMAALNSGVEWLPAGGGPLAANSPIRDLINR
jgi:hypothetical protein